MAIRVALITDASACIPPSDLRRLDLRVVESDNSARAINEPEPVRLDPLLTSGVLTICGIEGTAQEELYVKYALELDDGEAMSLAIAQARNFALATDERKARRVIRESRLQVRVISTPEVIRAWARGKARAELATVLRTIEARARFRPSSADPLEAWWCGLVDE